MFTLGHFKINVVDDDMMYVEVDDDDDDDDVLDARTRKSVKT